MTRVVWWLGELVHFGVLDFLSSQHSPSPGEVTRLKVVGVFECHTTRKEQGLRWTFKFTLIARIYHKPEIPGILDSKAAARRAALPTKFQGS